MEHSVFLGTGIFFVGIIAGFFNTIGGGGSLLVLPFLSFLGMDVALANGTNRIAIVLQCFTGAETYRRKNVLSLRIALPLAGITTLGSIVGTFLAINIDREFLNLSVAALISLMAVLLVFKPEMWEKQHETRLSKTAVFFIFFAIGIYGGFIQAGVGFFLTWGLALAAGVDLIRGNAIKMVIVGLYNIVSLAIFYRSGLVDIPVGLILAAGSMVGAVAGAKFAVAKGNSWIRWILASVVILSAVKMVFDVLS
ncbi:MAG: sulfite exporter TauE/SafE family protein [Aminobacteriaceae bacterium]|nr:sulfite exporter TauE/SafE family protein [Synergistaceae bacterium]MDD3390000.1 sulfite exporter TauE/SafE family protein [Synergistaceae bacterium]MDD4613027.1 sulfite exporter TauE/SafE family protein [Synergistaceae bacterium]